MKTTGFLVRTLHSMSLLPLMYFWRGWYYLFFLVDQNLLFFPFQLYPWSNFIVYLMHTLLFIICTIVKLWGGGRDVCEFAQIFFHYVNALLQYSSNYTNNILYHFSWSYIIHHCIYVDVPTFHTFVDVTIRALNVKLFDCLAILASVLLPEKKAGFCEQFHFV